MAILTGIAFGIFFTLSCATVESSYAPVESVSGSDSFNFQITEINQLIRTNPRNEELRVKKAEILYEYANTMQNPSDRKPVYQNLRSTADDARSMQNARIKIDGVLKRAWNSEQSNGIRLLQEDRSETYDTHYDLIIAHLENAIVIIPDSLVTYSLKSTTQYRRGHLNDAVSTLIAANSIARETRPEIKEKLAYLYLESGNYSESISIYTELSSQFPDRDYYIHGLVNALIVNNEHDDAVSILRNLSEQYPARSSYRISLATELFYVFSMKADQLSGNPAAIAPYENEINEAVGILEESRQIFSSLDSLIPSNEENNFRFGTFYMRASHLLHHLSELDIEDELAEELRIKSNEYMRSSLPYWERLTEMTSENMEYMNILRSVYLELGMNDEADSIERAFNF